MPLRSIKLFAFLLLLSAPFVSIAQDTAKDSGDEKQAAQEDKDKFEIKRSSKSARAKGKITFDDLKFKIEKDAPFKDEMITKDIKELDGKNVTISGWILPATLFKESGIEWFILVRDNQECCFGPGSALFDSVVIEMQDGNTTDYVTRSVSVTGKLKVDTKKYEYPGRKGPRGATHRAVFRIEGQSVK